MNTDRNQTHSSATPSLGSEERKEDEEMRRTGIIQSERQVFELAREYFGALIPSPAVQQGCELCDSA